MAVKKSTSVASLMAGRSKQYARKAYESNLFMGAINTLAVSEIDFNLSLRDGNVVLLHQACFWIADTPWDDIYATAGVKAWFGIAGSLDVTDINLARRTLYGSRALYANGTNMIMSIAENPLKIDWSNLPFGGMPVPPGPLCFAIDSDAMTVILQCSCELLYSVIRVAPPNALDMVQSLIPEAF